MKKSLETYFNELKAEMHAQLEFIKNEQEQADRVAKASYNYLVQVNQRLKSFLHRYRFTTVAEEIRFFKILKPQLLHLLIYHNQVYRICKNIPGGGYKAVRSYYKEELHRIRTYFTANQDFYRYYRTQNNTLDFLYFKRGHHDITLMGESHAFEFDEQYATPYSYKMSKILANEKLVAFLEDHLKTLDGCADTNRNATDQPIPMQWSLSKASLVELIYALDGAGALNNGTAQVKSIAHNFGLLFKTDLSDIYRIFTQIKDRKTSESKFIDHLKTAFMKRLEAE